MDQLSKSRADYLRTSEGFREFVLKTFDELKEQFIRKNDQYGDINPLGNFQRGALLAAEKDSPCAMYKVLLGYLNKHIVHIYGHGIAGNKIDESWKDNAIYSIIALALIEIYYNEKSEDMEDEGNDGKRKL